MYLLFCVSLYLHYCFFYIFYTDRYSARYAIDTYTDKQCSIITHILPVTVNQKNRKADQAYAFESTFFLNPFMMHNVEKLPNILLKSCDENTARFLEYV